MPKVSVLIPSYNHEKYVKEAITSVINQTFEDLEIIIVDDGSTDGTVAEIKKLNDPRIRLFCHDTNCGATVAMRKLLDEAKGDYFAVLSSDDVFMEGKIEKQVKFLEENDKIAAVFSYAQIIDDDGHNFTDENNFYFKIFEQPNRTRFEWLNYFFYNGNCLCHPSILIRRECYENVGYYDERLAQIPDLDFWIRICMKYEIYIIPEKLIKFRVRNEEANISGNRPETKRRASVEFFQVLKNYLAIGSVEEFIKIFPHLDKKYLEPELIPFALAMLALKVEIPAYKFFALNTLFDLLKNDTVAKKISKVYGFNYSDLIKYNGMYDFYSELNIFQVFWPIENQYSERCSRFVTINTNGHSQSIEVDIPAGTCGPLRIDPVNCSAFIEIEAIEIEPPLALDKNHSVIKFSLDNEFCGLSLSRGLCRLNYPDRFILMAIDDDPQLLFDFNSDKLNELPFKLRVVLKVDRAGIPDIVSFIDNELKQEQLTELRKDHEQLIEQSDRLKLLVLEQDRKSAVLEEKLLKTSQDLAVKQEQLERLYKRLEELELEIKQRDVTLAETTCKLKEKENQIDRILSSRSWKITSPLRCIASKIKRQRGAKDE